MKKISSLEETLKEIRELYGTFEEKERKLLDIIHKAEAKFLPYSLIEKLNPIARGLIGQIFRLGNDDLEESRVSSCAITKNGKVEVIVYINEILVARKEEEGKFRLKFQEEVVNLLKIPKDYIKISISSIGPF